MSGTKIRRSRANMGDLVNAALTEIMKVHNIKNPNVEITDKTTVRDIDEFTRKINQAYKHKQNTHKQKDPNRAKTKYNNFTRNYMEKQRKEGSMLKSKELMKEAAAAWWGTKEGEESAEAKKKKEEEKRAKKAVREAARAERKAKPTKRRKKAQPTEQ